MIAAFFAYGFLALAIFYLQNLAFFPQMHLRLLALLLFYLGLRPSLALALALAVALGVLQDSFAITPFGLHLGSALLVVGVARLFNQRLPQQRFGLQAAACLLAMVLQEVFWQNESHHPGLRRRTGLGATVSSRRGNSVDRGPGAVDVFTGAWIGKIFGPLRLAPQEPTARFLPASGIMAGELSPWPIQGARITAASRQIPGKTYQDETTD